MARGKGDGSGQAGRTRTLLLSVMSGAVSDAARLRPISMYLRHALA